VIGFIGTKVGMTQVFGPNGELIPVTVVEAKPCTVVQVRTSDVDGYQAVQVGYGAKRDKLANKPLRGHAAKAVAARAEAAKGSPADAPAKARKRSALAKSRTKGDATVQEEGAPVFVGLLEFRVDDASAYQVGQELKVDDVFKAGDKIDVRGVTKGKGYQGVVRRYGFKGQTATRGTHESFRGPGSVGNRSFPGRIFKGKRMDGHMGAVSRTIQNLEIVEVRADQSVVLVRGGLPGAAGEAVVLNPAIKRTISTPGGKKKASA
jgi:large subunit ribosomal protein L3